MPLARLILFCSLLVFIGLTGSLTMGMYVPSLPEIAHTFHATPTIVKYSITLYLVTYGTVMLFYGPLTDSFGRKRVVMLAVVFGLLGSLCCVFASSITMLLIGRLMQGAGYAAIGVSTPAMARHTLNDKVFAQVGSFLSMIFGLGPVLAPLLGSYIAHYFGWRTVFWVITGYSCCVLLAIIFFIRETLEPHERQRFHITPILKTYRAIITGRIFLANALSKSAAYIGFIVFYTVTPFMLQVHLHFTTVQYGWFTLALTITILITKAVNTVMLSFINIEKLIFYSTFVLALAGCLLLLMGLLNYYNAYAILLPFMLFGIASGFLFSNTTVFCRFLTNCGEKTLRFFLSLNGC